MVVGQFPIIPFIMRLSGLGLFAVVLMGHVLMANSLCRGREKRTMHKLGVQIGNSG
jgi:hypothetical protein